MTADAAHQPTDEWGARMGRLEAETGGECGAGALAATFWCVRVAGPDEVHAQPSKEEAEATAKAWNIVWERTGADDELQAFAEPWPWSPESHAADLAKQEAARAR